MSAAAFDPWHLVSMTTSAFAAVIAWAARDHVKRDDVRFIDMGAQVAALNAKIDTAITQTASNHSEILHLLLDRLPPKAA